MIAGDDEYTVMVTVMLNSQIGQIRARRIRTELAIEICASYDRCIGRLFRFMRRQREDTGAASVVIGDS